MAQPKMAPITCIQCNAWYSSERELRHHMQMAHRVFGAEHNLPPSFVEADTAKQGCTTSFQTEEEKEMDQLCARTQTEEKEEY
jgi:hypothetical protein